MTASGQHASLGEILDAVERDESLGGTPGGPGVSQERENPGDSPGSRDDTEEKRPDSEEAGGGKGNLFSQTDFLSKLPGLMQLIGEISTPVSSGGKVADPSSAAAQIALLAALRPYVSESRRRAMIRISRLSESLRSLQS